MPLPADPSDGVFHEHDPIAEALLGKTPNAPISSPDPAWSKEDHANTAKGAHVCAFGEEPDESREGGVDRKTRVEVVARRTGVGINALIVWRVLSHCWVRWRVLEVGMGMGNPSFKSRWWDIVPAHFPLL